MAKGELKLDFDDPRSPVVASEFVGTSITTNGDGLVYGPYYEPMVPFNPSIQFFDGDRRGYVIATANTTLHAIERADRAAELLEVEVE